MKTEPNDSAYPMVLNDDNFNSSNHQWGLSKLEAFTLAAMQGLCAASGNVYSSDQIGKDSVKIALKTIAALNESKTP